jgi:hypothetical protein
MTSPSSCRKCGSSRNRIVGQSAVPPGVFVRCEACGYSSLIVSESDAAAVEALDTRRVERLVRMVLDRKRLPCELQEVVKTAAGWQVTARVRHRDVVRFDLEHTGFAAMRAEIERALAAT